MPRQPLFDEPMRSFVTTRIPETAYKALKNLSEAEDKTVATLVREGVLDRVAKASKAVPEGRA